MNGIASQDRIRDASDILDASLSQVDFDGAHIYVVMGHPRSDIGKAELVARLGLLMEREFSIIKVDGFLNTNRDGSHPSRTRNDFVVYRRFHSHIAFGGDHLILNAPLMMRFFEQFGECREHLMFTPHLAKYFALQIYRNWKALGKPRRLIIEIGGTYQDNEVCSYIVPGLVILKRLSENLRFLLLAEAGFNREGIKSKPVIHSLAVGRTKGLSFDTVFVRLPSDFPEIDGIIELTRYVERKICDSMVYGGEVPTVVLIPYFNSVELSGYTEYLRGYSGIIVSNVTGAPG